MDTESKSRCERRLKADATYVFAIYKGWGLQMVRKKDLLQTTMFEEDPQKSILSKSKVHAERRDFF